MVKVNFEKDVVSVTLPNREILLRYEELHEISQAYTRYYIKESIAAYLKRHDREDLAENMEAIVDNMHQDVKLLFDDSETIADAILDATGEAV